MVEIGIVFGTRPEAIKMAPVVEQLKKSDLWNTKVIVSGQHREMLDQVLDLFAIVPDYDLNIISEGQSLAAMSARLLVRLDEVFLNWKPDYLIVHGDTTTALMAALAGHYHRIPVVHVEAGLRTGDLGNPFPEEANRKLIDGLSSLFFTPTPEAAANLRSEAIADEQIFVTGNTVIDALLMTVKASYRFTIPSLNKLSFQKPVVLVTAHRRENWGKPIENICAAIRQAALDLDIDIVFAMHKNPAIQAVVNQYLADTNLVSLIETPDYADFANLLSRCSFLVTDSGGLQEEAAALGKPVLVLRTMTERPEGIESGILKLIGTDKNRIVEEITNLVKNKDLYNQMAKQSNLYGDGKAAVRIKNIMEEQVNSRRDNNGNSAR